jgi:hypothetical protein
MEWKRIRRLKIEILENRKLLEACVFKERNWVWGEFRDIGSDGSAIQPVSVKLALRKSNSR